MAISYQEQADLTCPSCGADFTAAIWLILDAQEQPAAVDDLRRGVLNMVSCPHCTSSGPAGAPLLFHDAQARRVIFAGSPGAAEHAVRDQARDLHAILVGSIPEEQRRPYLADVDIAQDVEGVAHLLRRMDRRRSAAPAPTPTPDSRLPTPEPAPPLLLAVQELLEAGSPEDLDRVLAQHPLLLAPATDLTLAQLADVAVEQRAYAIAESLQQARRLLAQMGGTLTDLSAPDAEVPTHTLSDQALQAFMQAQSGAELLDAVRAHPLLLHPEVDGLLAERIDQALDEGHDRLASALEERREALAELRVARAVEVVAAPDDQPNPQEPTLEEAIEALLIADGEEAMVEVIDLYPVLLEEVATQALWQFASEARVGGDEELARYAIECREMLRRVREELGD
ncbi:hypothetical protein EKD04_023265 [Chloroflexales bacterium ZM16-3]|nr:hypothetical protein [Chloroflexales bacterium ZM16-3]